MALRPSKRQKRLQVPESQKTEEPAEKSLLASLRHSDRIEATQASAQARDASHKESRHSIISSPKERKSGKLTLKNDKGNAKKSSKKEHNSKGILSFFNAITQSQNATPNRSGAEHQEESDMIEDEPSEIGSALADQDEESQSRATGISGRSSIKRYLESSNNHDTSSTRFAPRPSFAFCDENINKPSGSEVVPSLSWSDAFPPESVNELALHPKKISSIRAWLQEAMHDAGKKSLLVLKGPAGCGKSAAIRAIAGSIDARLVEWENPIGFDYGSEGFVSLAVQFEDFLSRSSRFHPLDTSVPSILQSRSSTQPTSVEPEKRGFLLIEDFPNTFTWNSSALSNFRSSLLRYIADTWGQSHGVPRPSSEAASISMPLIMLVTETPGAASKGASDNLTVYKLLGRDVLHHPATTIIEINPVAPKLMANALDCLLKKQRRRSGKVWTPNSELIKRVSQFGDIRSAINALEYAYVSQDERRASKRHENSPSLAIRTAVEKSASSMVQREPVLDMFHSVGKVIYNKRLQEHARCSPIDQHQQPPQYLMQHSRPHKSEVSSEELMSSMGTDVETFVASLHENYVPSCTGENFIDTINGCIENLSAADILSSNLNYSTNRSNMQFRKQNGNENVDGLKQDEFVFQTAVRGMLFALPYPVERGKFSQKGNPRVRDPFKMAYPVSLRLWRQISDMEAIIGSWYYIIALGAQSRDAVLELGGAVHQRSNKRSQSEDNQNEQAFVSPWIIAPCNAVDRSEMILNYLPYLARIQPRSVAIGAVQDLHKLTIFSSSGTSDIDSMGHTQGDELDVAPNNIEETSAVCDGTALTRRPVDESHAQYLPGTTVSMHDKLVLSDDDIIDD